jgi:hypothetical protein
MKIDTVDAQFTGKQLLLTRLAWTLAFLFSTTLFAAGMFIAYFDYLGGNVPDILMARLTLPAPAFIDTLAFRVIEFTTPIVYLVAGILLFWRLGRYKMAWLTSLSMITGVPSTSAPLLSLGNLYPHWYPWMALLQTVGFTLFVIYFYVFPDGRFKPTWTRAAALAMLLFALTYPFCPACNPFATRSFVPIWILSGFMLLGLIAQIYRYRHLSTPTQRQQTKWVVLGFMLLLVGTLAILWPRILLPSVTFSGTLGELYDILFIPLIFLIQLIVPATFLLAITRSRLWDVDIIIRKTLQYSLLTGLLVLLYVALVVLVQLLFGQAINDSPLLLTLSTLLILALFNPLRRWAQEVIDRRFYRLAYDAQQVLENFAQTARDETDRETLKVELLKVVQETMQPENMSIWLKQ